ncbi:MAG: serine/threonine protein kinase [Candidatus Melainabacteria bacterium]|nr:serine/threonine protein kinase [Candidatus Melainabacteria bacterium]
MPEKDKDSFNKFDTPVAADATAGGEAEARGAARPNKMDPAFIRDNFFSLSSLDEIDDEDDENDDLDDLSEFTRQFVGSIIQNRYEVEEPIGRGGMSSVYRARDLTSGEKVAFKVMHAHLLDNPANVRRFRREAQAANKVRHPHAVKIFDVGVTPNGSPYIIMDYLNGPSLSDVIEKEGKLPVERCLKIFIQACEGMSHVHELGVLHRDLKPSNIVLVKEGDDEDYVKVVDFGIAKVLAEEARSTLSKTPTGHALGSPPYMSPEQCRGIVVDKRADVYSMGCLMYEALTGRVPLEGETIVETMYKQVHELPKSLIGVEADVRLVERLEKILFRALSKDPNNRQQSMDELKHELESLSTNKTSGFKSLALVSREMHEVRRRLFNVLGSSKKIVVSLICLVAIVVAVGVAMYSPLYGIGADPSAVEREIAIEQPRSPYATKPADFKVKEEYLRTRRSLAHQTAGENSAQGLAVERMIADFYRLAGRYNEAQQRYQFSLKIAANIQLGNSLEAAELWLECGRCCILNGKFQIAQICAANAMADLEGLSKMGGQDYLKALAISVDSFRGQKLLARADDAALKFMKLWKDSGQSALLSNEMGYSCYSVAEHLRLRNYYDMADPLFRQAAACFRENGDKGRYNYALVLNQMGLLEMARNKPAEAKKYFEKSIAFFTKAKGKEDISVAKVLFNLKDAEMKAGEVFQGVATRAAARKIWNVWEQNSQESSLP